LLSSKEYILPVKRVFVKLGDLARREMGENGLILEFQHPRTLRTDSRKLAMTGNTQSLPIFTPCQVDATDGSFFLSGAFRVRADFVSSSDELNQRIEFADPSGEQSIDRSKGGSQPKFLWLPVLANRR
jgi:hypothetical protein